MLPRQVRKAVIDFVKKQRSRENRADESTAKINAFFDEFKKLNAEIPALNSKVASANSPIETHAAIRDLATNYENSARFLRECEKELARIISIAGNSR